MMMTVHRLMTTAIPVPERPALSVGSSRSGQIETGSDIDYFRVQVSGSGELTVYTTGSLDTLGTLEDSSGSSLSNDDDSGNSSNFRIARTVSAGTYYVKVESYESNIGKLYSSRELFGSRLHTTGEHYRCDQRQRAALSPSPSPSAPPAQQQCDLLVRYLPRDCSGEWPRTIRADTPHP